MSGVVFHRPVRALPPAIPGGRVTLPAVPQEQRASQGSAMMTLAMPVMSSVMMAGYMFSYGKPLLIVIGVVFVVGSIGTGLIMRHQMRKGTRKNKAVQRARYLEYLTGVRQAAREVATQQRFAAAWAHPSPERLWAISVRRRRVWERRAADPDFLRVRLGLGRDKLATAIGVSGHADPLAEYDPQVLGMVQRLTDRLCMVGRQPAWADLGNAGVVSVLGPPARARALARAMLMQIAVLHAPDDVAVIVCTADDPGWEWAKWLPHTRCGQTAERAGDPGEAGLPPLVAAGMEGLADVLRSELEQASQHRPGRGGQPGQIRLAGPQLPVRRRLLVVVDSYDPAAAWAQSPELTGLLEAAGPESGITVVCLVAVESAEPTRTQLRARVGDDGTLSLEGPRPELRGAATEAVADQAGPVLAELTARALAPLRLSQEPDRLLVTTISMPEMLGITDLATFNPAGSWLDAEDEQVLLLPIGRDADGEPVELDLKESAQGGMGPHGLVVGATGSGKSELLRTLVTGLTMTHSPELLSLVLVDFKGGATFAGLTELPHVAGLITNLADDLSLVDRVRAALHGEQQRRQKLLRDAGNADSLLDYHARRAAGHTDAAGKPLQPLPYLLIVVDEFGELLSQRSDFIDLFVQIGRVGRSLGMHLLLATQRLDEGRLRGLESHLSYRICLRTFSAAESRAVIGTTDAYQLPPIPGSAYLKVSEATYRRFRVAHMSGPYHVPGDAGALESAGATVTAFGLRTAPPDRPDGRPEQSRPRSVHTGPTAMRVAIEQLCRFGESVHQVWLPPLPSVIALDALLGPLTEQPGRGWQAAMWPRCGRLSFPVGLIDLPFQQRQEPLVLDFARKHGNLAVVGAPQTGKSGLLRTLMLSAMLTHTPEETQFYCLDYGGGTLAPLAAAPHVGAVAGRRDPQTAGRLLSEMLRLITAREQLFAEHAVDSPAAFRTLAGSGRLPAGTRAADVFVVIDNWGAVRADLEDADDAVTEIAFRGLGVGVHLILTASRWADIRVKLRDGIGARLELRLNDPAESEVNRQLARQLAASPAGRGVVPPGLLFHCLASRLDGMETMEDIGDSQDETIAKIAASWTGAVAPPVRLLPDLVRAADLAGHEPAAGARSATAVPIGLGDADLGPVSLDLSEDDPHLLILGDAGAGKTVFLRTLLHGLAGRHGPNQVRFMLVDFRRSLLDALPPSYVGAYAGDAPAAREYASQLAAKLAGRMPPPGLSSGELRARTWWSGPELYLVADDYDLAATGQSGPLAPLIDYIPQAREIGLHIILARRVSGMSRALTSDPLLTRIRDLGTAGLILSGDAREGVLLGSERAAPRPPGRGMLIRRRQPPVLIQVATATGLPDSPPCPPAPS